MKKGQIYWTVAGSNNLIVAYRAHWYGDVNDYLLLNEGLIYETREEAEKLGIPKVKKLFEEKENEILY